MAAAKKTAAKTAAAKKAPARKKAAAKANANTTPPNAIELLTTDHAEVRQLFEDYEDLTDADDAADDDKQELAERICRLLSVHAQIEEEIFYPAAKESIEEDDLVDEATVEHATAKDLIAQIRQMLAGDDLYDAKVKVLGEYIEHHVKEEESEMFPQAEESEMDLEAIGEELAARKQELMAEMGGDQEEETESA